MSSNRINRKTGNRLKQQNVDSETGEVVSRDDMVRGYEIAKGQYMVVEDEETEAVQIESGGSLNYDERRRDRTSAALDRSPPKMTNAR